MVATPSYFVDAEQCADQILSKVGKQIVLGLPAGLGKANSIANALYDRAASDREVQLEILTALTLGRIEGHSELERRFLEPLMDRFAGNYPELKYNQAIRAGGLPENVKLHEFFLPAARLLNAPIAQQNYISCNYTYVNRTLLERGVNVIAPLVAQRRSRKGTELSLSCNPDVTLDLIPAMHGLRRSGSRVCLAAQVNEKLPFMLGPAVIKESEFDFILGGSDCQFDLFSVPKQPVSATDYAAALHVASLIEDGGTLQIGIGGFGDALTQVLKLRHLDNETFRTLARCLDTIEQAARQDHLGTFSEGLYGCSEMLVEGLLELKRCGVIKRRVGGQKSSSGQDKGPMIHAALFVGSRALLEQLRQLPESELADIAMTSVSYVNQLYGAEELKRSQRLKARFVNSALIVTALGDVTSDELSNGRVISGVGGQYNFVAQAHELADARSIIALNATRTNKGHTASNIVWDYGHITIPRHLRDIVVTEYGIADLRGKSDRDVIAAMLNITDTRFQSELLETAKKFGKIESGYSIPERYSANLPDKISSAMAGALDDGTLPVFPLGTEMTPVEVKLLSALMNLKGIAQSRSRLLFASLSRAIGSNLSADEMQCLHRLELHKPHSFVEWLLRWSVIWGLRSGQSL